MLLKIALMYRTVTIVNQFYKTILSLVTYIKFILLKHFIK